MPIETVPIRKVFTPFFNIWKTHLPKTKLQKLAPGKFYCLKNYPDISHFIPQKYHEFFGYDFGISRLRDFDFASYIDTRNFPWKDGSTRLSPYIRFGVFSIREVLLSMETSQTLISELAWREFWYHIAHHFPETHETAFQMKRRHIEWENSPELCQKIEDAET